ncbi:5'-nucleotidase C-terminal domain-containing protein [Flavobacterium sp. H122]|uniref:5'-nucleotidase C-terminal domain-containing protein n=1 Tax=Flavobacterium sp. H122 TaxID=2529860 RepID=UPI0010A9C6CC|nr:5'-nucleotidase [Flavobacterium sp. H122]
MKHFGLILTLFTLSLTAYSQNVVTEIHGKQIRVDASVGIKQEYEDLIAPYKQQINKDLDKILAYNPQLLDKTKGNQFQSNIGDLFAQITLDKANKVFSEREKKFVDIAILNNGGIRAVIPMGNVTSRSAYEVMPFENTAVVLEVKGQIILDFVNFFIKDKKPHPFAGMTFTITADKKAKDIKIGGADLDLEKTYYIVTNDYLANGGDKMEFLLKASRKVDIDYKLRNMLIDYFTDVDVVSVPKAIKVTQE